MKKTFGLSFLIILHLSEPVYAAQPFKTCGSASVLTDNESQILLYMTPAAVSARSMGTDVDIEKSKPTTDFPARDFFVAGLVSKKPTNGSVLGNGILGYFAVDKRTAEVTSTTSLAIVNGQELSRVQDLLRDDHCIKYTADATTK